VLANWAGEITVHGPAGLPDASVGRNSNWYSIGWPFSVLGRSPFRRTVE
jgi:hypothetical protein